MAKIPTWLAVAAAAIRDRDGRFLLQQRAPGKMHAGLWEFPGGKVENGENPRFALRREVTEELALTLETMAMVPAGFAEEAGETGRPGIVLFLYDCPVWSGEPEAREGQRWGWFSLSEARAMPMPPMDRALLEGPAR